MIDSLVPAGAESSLAAMAPELVRRGVRLDVVALKTRPGLRGVLEAAGATVIELEGSRRTWWRQVRAITRDRRPTLVHTTLFESDLAGRVAARLAGTPVVSTWTSESYGDAHRAEHPTRRARLAAAQLSDALTARLATRVHAVSEHVATTMSRRLRYPRERIDVIPRGRDPRLLGTGTPERRARVRQALGVHGDTPLVLAVARHEPAKGLDVLADALGPIRAGVPTARVLVAGSPGTASGALGARAGGETALELLGARDDVADLLAAADVFVLPSRREGLPGALLEAMALGCPAVVSDLPQVREVVDDATAVLVPTEDPAALGAAIVATLHDPDAATRRAHAAHARFLERFTIAAVADQMLAFYERALGRAPR